jgi:CelD/BcsL family acetyltransferase involved in cellulose biosynthesis
MILKSLSDRSRGGRYLKCIHAVASTDSEDVAELGSRFAEPEVIHLSEPSDLKDLTREWLDLASRIPGTSYFQTPDWVLSWWLTLGRKPFTELALWRHPSGSLQGVMFLSRLRQRIHPRLPPAWSLWTATGSGVGDADHVGWPILPERRDDALRYLVRRTRGSTVFLQSLDPESGVPFVPPAARKVFRNPCPRVPLLPFESLPAEVRRTRSHLRRYEKKAEAAGIKFRWVASAQMDEPFLARFLELHAQRVADRALATAFPASAELQRQLIARGSPDRGPVAFIAEQEHRMVGILYFVRWQDTIAFYQSGWQPDLARLALGRLLFNQSIRDATANGLHTLDLLRGDEEYKYRLGGVDRWDESWIAPGGASGLILKALLPAYRFATRYAWGHRGPASS